jgi:hypothetical protein
MSLHGGAGFPLLGTPAMGQGDLDCLQEQPSNVLSHEQHGWVG